MSSAQKPDYGVDAPGVIRNLALLGVGALAVSPWLGRFRSAACWYGAWTLTSPVLMLLYAKIGKFRHCEHMLSLRRWSGEETVLDVGTGRGLLAIAAAKRLTTGKAVGIDIWNAEDLSGNGEEATRRNIAAEGVASRVELKTEDARKLSFPDASFDVVLSNLALHNIYDEAGRTEACREIARVLKPGGDALISDFRHTADYARALGQAGLVVRRGPLRLLDTFPPLRVVEALKPRR